MNPDDVIKVLQAIKEMAEPGAIAVLAMATKAKMAEGVAGLSAGLLIGTLGLALVVGCWIFGRKAAEEQSDGWGAVALVSGLGAGIALVVGIGIIGSAIPLIVAPEFYGLLKLLGR